MIMKNFIVRLFCFTAFLLIALDATSQHVSVKTNALMLGGGFPNLGIELVTGKRTSFEFSGFGCYKPYNREAVVVGAMPEFRYWISGRPMVRSYIGLNALVASYRLNWNDKTFRGDAGGLGIGFGYSLVLSPRWNIEFGAGVGAVYFRQQKYSEQEKYDLDYPTDKGFKFFPTKLAISVAYIIK